MGRFIIVAFAPLLGFSVACSSFKPIIVPGWPDECNVMATVAKLEESDKEKKISAACVALCYKALKRRACQVEVYGIVAETKEPKAVNYDDAKAYRNYTQCLTERD